MIKKIWFYALLVLLIIYVSYTYIVEGNYDAAIWSLIASIDCVVNLLSKYKEYLREQRKV